MTFEERLPGHNDWISASYRRLVVHNGARHDDQAHSGVEAGPVLHAEERPAGYPQPQGQNAAPSPQTPSQGQCPWPIML